MRKKSTLKSALFPLLAAAVLAAGCDAETTLPSVQVEQVVETHASPLVPGGSNRYLFTLLAPSTVQLMLAGAVVDNPLQSVAVTLRIGLARWDGTESVCTPIQTFDLEPRLTPAMQVYLDPGTYCATVADPGSLPYPVGTILRMTAPALVKTAAEPGTASWSSAVTIGGRATRSMQVSSAGTVSITLNSLSVDSTAEAGIGVGLVDAATGTCQVSRTVFAKPGPTPQLVAPIGAGVFCAVVYDRGAFTVGEQQFQVTIAHP